RRAAAPPARVSRAPARKTSHRAPLTRSKEQAGGLVLAKRTGISTAATRDGGCPMDDLRYPIGRFEFDSAAAPQERAVWIDELAQLPGMLRQAVAGLDDRQLDTPYREGGWTVRQVVHHVA